MLSINTNLSSLIAQNSMKTSTDKLNQAIERMTTGLKINHASDNAANYSISTNLTTQLSAYDTAADNVAMGMDLVNTANDIISQMQDKAARLNALSTQARNGTYGAQSLSALNSEASAIMGEIMRLYNTAEYNDISLFNQKEYTIAPHLPQAGESGFIDETALISPTDAGPTTDAPVAKYDGFIEDPKHPNGDAYVDGLTSVTQAIATTGLTSGGEYKVGGVNDLKALATYVNDGNNTSGITFIMSEDIDLSGEANWTPIGDSINPFKGTFDGNGHVIKNLKIDRETSDYQGLFGCVTAGELKNVGLEGVNIKGKNAVGGLVGNSYSSSSSISNSYATGNVTGQGQNVGGLVGISNGALEITNCYTIVNVTSENVNTGGLVGFIRGTSTLVSNNYSLGSVTGQGNYVGGLIGQSHSAIENSYATGDVSGTGKYVGGLVGGAINSSSISNSYATGAVTGQDYVGGLVGESLSSISNSCATGAVNGNNYIGGLMGVGSSISNSYATGNVTGGGTQVGGLAGSSRSTISNSYATGNVTGGGTQVGGLAGSSRSTISNSYATGNVTGQTSTVGGLVGEALSDVYNSYATGNVIGNDEIGGLIGVCDGYLIQNCYATGNVYGSNIVGGLAGLGSHITNSYSTGNVSGNDEVGGLVGVTGGDISNSYTTGDIVGQSFVGGLAGRVSAPMGTAKLTGSVSYSKVSGADSASTGSLIGGAMMTFNGTSFGTLNISNCQSRPIEGMNKIGGAFDYNYNAITFDLSSALAGISDVQLRDITTNLQVGIFGDDSCRINFNTNFEFDLSKIGDIQSVETFDAIVAFENLLSEKATQLGAVQNRLDSALESIEVNINNLTSSRSTIRDADIAEVSSDYIRQQILQQASATLLATANQSPSIALQLI